MLKGKKIVLGITGSIAAYKACLILRLLVRQGAEVQVVITEAGKQFITPVTLSALSGKPVVSEFFAASDGTWHSHVDLGIWADAMLIAPCTASSLGKMAHGIADNMLITTYLSMKAPVFVAPAMDLDMYAHPSTQANIDRLRQVGNIIIEPQAGFLASGLEGKGRMEEPESIVATLEKYFEGEDNGRTCAVQGQLAGKKVLITAGPTYERIDPVRFIGNYSSGKMGFALAEECSRRGADVVLVAGPVSLQSSVAIRRIDVESADEMHAACVAEFAHADDGEAHVLAALGFVAGDGQRAFERRVREVGQFAADGRLDGDRVVRHGILGDDGGQHVYRLHVGIVGRDGQALCIGQGLLKLGSEFFYTHDVSFSLSGRMQEAPGTRRPSMGLPRETCDLVSAGALGNHCVRWLRRLPESPDEAPASGGARDTWPRTRCFRNDQQMRLACRLSRHESPLRAIFFCA